jgi:cobalt-zinc-cadmium efflux system membrane fusion protein
MAPWARSLAAWAVGRIPTLLSLAALFGLAVWGIAYDWKIPRFSTLTGQDRGESEEGPKTTIQTVPGTGPPASEGGSASIPVKRIDFPSAEVVCKTGIQVEPAVVREISRYVTAHAMLDYEPGRFTQLASPVDGRVWSLEKEYGARVKANDVLAIIDSTEVGKAKADFLQSEAQVDVAASQLEALHAARSSVPEGTYRKAEAALRAARGLPIRLADVDKLSDAQRARYVRLLGLESILKRIDNMDTLTANLYPLKAPFDGEVVRHPRAAPGEVVSASRPQPLFVVADVRHLHIELEVNQEDAALLRIGQEVTFVAESRGGEPAHGPLEHISPEVNEKTRHVLAHAEVANPEGRLRPNTFGTGRIRIHKPRAVVVPSAAAQDLPGAPDERAGGSHVVFIRLSPTSFEARPVVTGIQENGFTEVTSGVRPGEQVVTTGAHVLKSHLLKDRIAGDD